MAVKKLYLDDAYCFENEAVVLCVDGEQVTIDATCLYPGGGGQPADTGTIQFADGMQMAVVAEKAPEGAAVVRCLEGRFPDGLVGGNCAIRVDAQRRIGLMRYHTALHVFNAVMMREFRAWVNGVSMAPDHSRIDFNVEGFDVAMRDRAEELVNAVLARNLPTRAVWVSAEEYLTRPELRRTLHVAPPMENGRVRVVEIGDFDAQACGGTHVRLTSEVGRFKITKAKSQSRDNRRFHVLLESPDSLT